MARRYRAKGYNSAFEIDMHELDDFVKKLGQISEDNEKKRKDFIRKQGTSLRRDTAKKANELVNKTAVSRKRYSRVAGQYHKSIKRGRYYKYRGLTDCIRVYSSDPISHLVELGWKPSARVSAGTRFSRRSWSVKRRRGAATRGNFRAGEHVFEYAKNDFENKYKKACEELVTGYIAEIEK